MTDERVPHELSDALWLWWLEKSRCAATGGELRTARTLKGVSLTYGSDWLASGVAWGVSPRDIDSLAAQIDRPALASQREASLN